MEYTYISLDIKPASSFASELASDTFFGQICYMLYMQGYDLDEYLKDYENDPFFVISDFFPMGYISIQQIPVKPVSEINIYNLAARKALKNKNKIKIDELINKGILTREKNGLIKETVDISNMQDSWKKYKYDVIKAHINRYSGTTLNEEFAPYSNIEYSYMAKKGEFYFRLYLYVKEGFDENIIIAAIENIGKTGYGSKTSTGKGFFKVYRNENIKINTENKDVFILLSNTVISGMDKCIDEMYYTPVTRFGKHGILTEKGTPFKNPFVMATSGALALNVKNECFNKAYVGKGVFGLSYHKNAVSQGYGLYIPLKLVEE